jgi:GNAT superfamily N-acetyltransferase
VTAEGEVLVRAARPADAPVLAAMVAALAAHHGEASAATVATLARDLFAPGAEIWLAALVAERAASGGGGGTPVGYAVVFRAYPVQLAELAVVVEHLYVAPEARGRGVGAALLRACRAQGRAWGCAQLVVAARADNAAAQRFYERQGMKGRPRGGVAYRESLA